MTYNIAPIGAGRLGRRHLQGLSSIPLPSRLFWVEINPDCRQAAELAFRQCGRSPSIQSEEYFDRVDQLPGDLDAVLVATNSDARPEVIRNVPAHAWVEVSLLEKFLSPRFSDHDAAAQLFERHGVESYVNCPRRRFPHYEKRRECFKNETILDLSVNGGNVS